VAIVTGDRWYGVSNGICAGRGKRNLVLAARKFDRCIEVAKTMEEELGIKVIPARILSSLGSFPWKVGRKL